MALRNLKERLTLMYDTDAKIRNIQSDGLFRVEIILPYRKKISRSFPSVWLKRIEEGSFR